MDRTPFVASPSDCHEDVIKTLLAAAAAVYYSDKTGVEWILFYVYSPREFDNNITFGTPYENTKRVFHGDHHRTFDDRPERLALIGYHS